MTTAIRRPAVLVAALTALVMALSACGSGPSQVNAAVIIDGHRISVDDVQAVLDKVVREQPAARPLARQHKLDLVAREIVSQLIVHEMLAGVARKEGVRADGEQVAALLSDNPLDEKLPTDGSVPPEALATQLVYRARDARDVVTDQLLLRELGAKYADRLAVRVDYTSVASDDPGAKPTSMREKAEAKGREFAANPERVGQLIQKDTQAQVPSGEDTPAVGSELLQEDPQASPEDNLQRRQQAVQLLSSAMFGTAPNSVVVFQPDPAQALWYVMLIRERDTNASGSGIPQLDAQELIGIGERMLQPYVDDIDIQISPRYGVWDPVAMGVAPSEAERAGLVLPVKTARQ